MDLSKVDLTKLSDSDLHALQAGKLDQVSDEGLQHIASHSQAAPAPQGPSTSAPMAALEGYGNTATLGYLPQLQAGAEMGMEKLAKLFGAGPEAADDKLRAQGFNIPEHGYVQERDANIARQKQEESEHPIAATAGKGLGIAATMAMPGAATKWGAQLAGRVGQAATLPGKLMSGVNAAEGAGFLGRTGAAAANGVIQGATYNPGDTKGVVAPLQAKDRAINGVAGGVFNAVTHAGSESASKLGDFLMQKAMGLKKYVPGLGQKMADEGVIGTKGMMRGQVERGMQDAGQQMDAATQSIPGVHPTDKALENVQGLASDFQMPNGQVPTEAASHYNKVGDAVQDLMNTGPMKAPDMWARGKINGKLGFGKTGEPMNQLDAQIAQARQQGFSDTLKGASPEFAKGAERYSDLADAHRALSQKETLPEIAKSMLIKGGIGGALGYAADGNQGALMGALASTPAGMSVGGRAAMGSSKLADALKDPVLRAILEQKRDSASGQ